LQDQGARERAFFYFEQDALVGRSFTDGSEGSPITLQLDREVFLPKAIAKLELLDKKS
jgi:hypothetical protein